MSRVFAEGLRTRLEIVYCPRCKKHFSEQVGFTRYRCATMHSPPDCCHHGDQELTQEQIDKIWKVLGRSTPKGGPLRVDGGGLLHVSDG